MRLSPWPFILAGVERLMILGAYVSVRIGTKIDVHDGCAIKRSPTPRMQSQEGSAPIVELALGAAVMVIAVWLVIWAGSGGQTTGLANTAAHDAARVATTIRDAPSRPAAATNLVDQRMAGSDCDSWSTTTASSATTVTVTVTCRLATAQMAGLGVPARTITSTGRSSIDPYFVQD